MIGCQLELETVSGEGCATENPVVSLRISARRDAEELAAVPVEVGPARVLPGQPRRAGEWDAYPRGELGGG